MPYIITDENISTKNLTQNRFNQPSGNTFIHSDQFQSYFNEGNIEALTNQEYYDNYFIKEPVLNRLNYQFRMLSNGDFHLASLFLENIARWLQKFVRSRLITSTFVITPFLLVCSYAFTYLKPLLVFTAYAQLSLLIGPYPTLIGGLIVLLGISFLADSSIRGFKKLLSSKKHSANLVELWENFPLTQEEQKEMAERREWVLEKEFHGTFTCFAFAEQNFLPSGESICWDKLGPPLASDPSISTNTARVKPNSTLLKTIGFFSSIENEKRTDNIFSQTDFSDDYSNLIAR